jgi:hypothetical protein
VYVSQASEAAIRRIFAGAGRAVRGLTRVTAGMRIGDGEHTIRLEPLDLPNAPGSMMAFSPRSGWLYLPDATSALDVAVARERARALGWVVRSVGTAVALQQPASP